MNNYIPQVGDIKSGREINKSGTASWQKFIRHACIDCGRERWVLIVSNKPDHERCHNCSNKINPIKKKSYISGGYKYIKLKDDEKFFLPMTIANGYIKEHRLVVAKALGRNLHRWEIIHHKNHIKDDNRLENLQLISDDRHNQITIMETRIKQLESRVTQLEAENILLKSQTLTV